MDSSSVEARFFQPLPAGLEFFVDGIPEYAQQGMVEVNQGIIKPAELGVGTSPVNKTINIVWIYCQGAGEIFYGIII